MRLQSQVYRSSLQVEETSINVIIGSQYRKHKSKKELNYKLLEYYY